MKLKLELGLLVLLFAIFCDRTPLAAQTDSLNEVARSIWQEKSPRKGGNQAFRFDRITVKGELIVYERFNPASFIILKKTSEGFSLVGYSFNNLFFGNTAGTNDQPELLEALAIGKKGANLLKGTKSVTRPVGPLIHTQWGQAGKINRLQ